MDQRRPPGGDTYPPPQSASGNVASQPFDTLNFRSDVVVIIATLLCAVICVLGLVVVSRCAWIRRLGGEDLESQSSTRSPAAANKGLKKKVLNSIPKLTIGDNSAAAAKLSECAICLTDFESGEEVRILPQCGHGFHVVCIDAWLGSHSSCPSCRQILVATRCRQCGKASAASRLQSMPRENHVNAFLP